MIAVITVLAVFAAAIVPRLGSMVESQTQQRAISDIRQLPLDARSRAIQSASTINLTTSGTELVLRRNQDGEETDVRTVSLPDGARFTNAKLNGQDSATDTWSIGFSSDGRSDSGSIEIELGGRVWTLRIRADGNGQLVSGQGTTDDDTKWKAGELEVRQ
jgi:type II secretory pathway pseudopilin PulG